MRFAIQLAFSATAVLTFAACGGRIPPQINMKTDHYVGSWIDKNQASNITAEGGGTDQVRVLNITSSLEMTEEVRVAGEPPPDSYYVGKLYAKLNEPAEMRFDKAKLGEVKVGKREKSEIEQLTKAPLSFSVSTDRKSATEVLTVEVDGQKVQSARTYVKLSSEERVKLKLNPEPKISNVPPPPKPPENRPGSALQDPRGAGPATKR